MNAATESLILLDRDGVINADSPDYIKSLEEFILLPGSLDAIAALSGAGFRIGICTNQSGVGRGLFTLAELGTMHEFLRERVSARGGVIDVLEFCPHLPGAGCDCRKPRPGMLIRAMNRVGISPERTCFVGDSVRDIEAALKAGVEPVLVRTAPASAEGLDVESRAKSLGVKRIYDDLATFATAIIAERTNTKQ